MFGLSLPCQLIQGPAIRTWNCVAHFANLIWCKFNYTANPIMPRSRRRHHSRSRTRSRSRSHSCDKDRDTKRRKIENFDSPQYKRSDSPEDDHPPVVETIEVHDESVESIENSIPSTEQESSNEKDADREKPSCNSVVTPKVKVSKTPKKPLTPKQLQKEIEKTQRMQERERIKEEKLRLLEEKKKLKQEENEKRLKEKREKLEEKQREIEERQKNRDLKEEKRKQEREERELKRKEKEEKEELKRREQDEKNKEKQKIEQKKQKTVSAFVSFFTKKSENDERKLEKPNTYTFMPFEVKSDMRVAPICRVTLDSNQKNYIVETLASQLEQTYLDELKSGRKIRKSPKTWPFTEFDRQDGDVVIVEDVVPGESIDEQPKPPRRQKAKFLKFGDNRRPAYFGTWRKNSCFIKPRRPFTMDTTCFDYDVDSDEEWEEEDSGESLRGSDDDKENDSENEYEEDNEFFVPHGHLSDDEVNDDENSEVSPEAHKAKLKLLKKEFEEEMRSKTEKIKPRVIGCIWYNKDGKNVDAAIDEFLKPLSIISNGPIVIKKRSKFVCNTTARRSFLPGKELSAKFVPDFLKLIHGSSKNAKALVEDFLTSLEKRDINVEVSKTSLVRQLKKLAVWTRSPEGGPVLKKYCWFVRKNIEEEYNVDLPIPN